MYKIIVINYAYFSVCFKEIFDLGLSQCSIIFRIDNILYIVIKHGLTTQFI